MSLVSTTEAADILNRSEMTIRRWAASGKIEGQKIGKSWMIESNSLPNRRPVPRTVANGQHIRILRIIEYIYEDADLMINDMSHWKVGANATFEPSRGKTIRSAVLPAELYE